jgi:hypothetical protein
VERAPRLAARDRPLRLARALNRVGRERHDGVEPRVDAVDATQVRLNHFDRRHLARANLAGEFGRR